MVSLHGLLWRTLRVGAIPVSVGKRMYSDEAAGRRLGSFLGGRVRLESESTPSYSPPNSLRIVLSNPSKKNALSGSMMVELRSAVDDLKRRSDASDARIVLIEGEGDDFCTGGELDFVRQIANSADAYLMCTFMEQTMRRLRSVPLISIANLRGFALGGGTEIAASADLRVAHVSAKAGFVQSRMGVSPGWGGGRALVDLLGRARALELLATGAVLDAAQLKDVGYVQFVYETDDQLRAYLEKFTRTDPSVIAELKGWLADADESPEARASFEAERRAFARLWGGDAQARALAARPKHNK